MQAALQSHVDNAISKTINVPADLSFAELRSVYELAWDKGLKGCATFRPNPVTGEVLTELQPAGRPHCCAVGREGDQAHGRRLSPGAVEAGG